MFINTTSVNKIVNEFITFAYTNKIMTFFIGTFMGVSTSNLILSFRKNILDYILTKIFNLGNLNTLFFITSIIEFILMLTALYFIIKLIKPYFDKKDAAIKIADDSYQTKLLNTLNRIDMKLQNNEPTTSK